MTSEQLIQSYYEAFNAKNWSKMLSYVDEQILHESNQGDPQKGKVFFEKFLQRMDTNYDERLSEFVFMAHPNGQRVAAEFICEGKYKIADSDMPPAHGQKYRLRVGAFFEVANGKITRVTNYYNLKDWLEQVS